MAWCWRLLLWAASLSFAAERDLYAILELERTATPKQVKKAYRRLSLRWHPDKNADSKEAEAKFVDISQAYSVLSDPEKRKNYDKYGEKGLDVSGAASTFQHVNPFEIFNKFFGKENSTENPYANLFSEDTSEVLEITPENWKEWKTHTTRNIWVAYYWPNCTACPDLHNGFVEVAAKFEGIVSVGAVNCKRWEVLCLAAKRERCEGIATYKQKMVCLNEEAKSGESNDPLLVYYGPHASHSLRPQQGDYSFKSLSKWIAGAMGSFASEIRSEKDLSTWLRADSTMKFVFLATKSEVPPQVKGLSMQFHGRASFGAVLSGASELKERFRAEARPALLRVLDPGGLSLERCEQELKPASMAAFVTRALGKARRLQATVRVGEWTEDRLRAGDCAPHDESFCLLLFLAEPADDARLIEAMQQMASRLQDEPVKVFYAPMRLAAPFASADGDVVLFSPRAMRLRRFRGDPLSIAELASFMDSCISTGRNTSVADPCPLEALSQPLPYQKEEL